MGRQWRGVVSDRDAEARVWTILDIKKHPQDEKCVHRFWRHGMICIFDIRVTDLDANKYEGTSGVIGKSGMS